MSQKSLGLVETYGLLAAVEAADTAVKAANVQLVGYERARGSGLTTIKVEGDVGAVKAAVAAAVSAADKVGTVAGFRVIARPAEGIDHLVHNQQTVGYAKPEAVVEETYIKKTDEKGSKKPSTKATSAEKTEEKDQQPEQSEVKPEPPKQSETKPEPPKQIETKPEPPKQSETKPEPPKQSEAKPEPPKQIETKPEPPKQNEVKPATPAGETSSDKPVKPAPARSKKRGGNNSSNRKKGPQK